jgi:hypothetical protein
VTERLRWGVLATMGGLIASCVAPAPSEALGTRALPLERASWSAVTPGSVATSRSHHLLVYDEARRLSVLFGGRPPSDSGASLADTGTWDGRAWAAVSSTLGRRGYISGAYDSARERTVVYGGADIVGGGNVYFDDTWELDGTGWSRRDTAGPPGKRSSYGLAYDRQRAVTVLFGGYDAAWKGDLWEWDGASWRARCSAAPCSTAPRPAARANPVFVYDQARMVTVLFGGFGNGSSYDDTWTWDGEVWRQLSPAHSPSGRDSAAATYDPVGQRVLVFGGVQGSGQESNELWAWEGTDWTRISAAAAPAARQGAGFAWDVERARGVLIGGRASRSSTGASELSVVLNACSLPQDCAVGTCVAGICSSAGGAGAGGMGGATSNGGTDGGTIGGSTTSNGGTSGARSYGGAGAASNSGSTSSGSTSSGASSGGGGEGSNEAPSGGDPSVASEGGAPQRGEPTLGGDATQADTQELRETQSFYSCAAAPTSSKQPGERFALGGLFAALAWSWGRRAQRRSRRG